MKNSFLVALLFFGVSTTIGLAQTKKPTITKKPMTMVKSNIPKTTTTKKTTTTTTTTTTPAIIQPPVVEEKKTTTIITTTTTPTETQSTITPSSTTTTTTTQSTGPSKGNKVIKAKVRATKPERVRESRSEKGRTPRVASSDNGGVRFGIRVEASQALTFESGGSFDISPGVNAGLFANIPLSEKIYFQPEVLYSMQVAKVDPVKNTANSILVPISFNFNLGSGSTKFVISPGGYADYNLSASNTTNGVTVVADLTGADKFYYGAMLGLGVKLNNNLLIEARSFYDLRTSNNKSFFATLGIGYMF